LLSLAEGAPAKTNHRTRTCRALKKAPAIYRSKSDVLG
jgi:hypothetical protein